MNHENANIGRIPQPVDSAQIMNTTYRGRLPAPSFLRFRPPNTPQLCALSAISPALSTALAFLAPFCSPWLKRVQSSPCPVAGEGARPAFDAAAGADGAGLVCLAYRSRRGRSLLEAVWSRATGTSRGCGPGQSQQGRRDHTSGCGCRRRVGGDTRPVQGRRRRRLLPAGGAAVRPEHGHPTQAPGKPSARGVSLRRNGKP